MKRCVKCGGDASQGSDQQAGPVCDRCDPVAAEAHVRAAIDHWLAGGKFR